MLPRSKSPEAKKAQAEADAARSAVLKNLITTAHELQNEVRGGVVEQNKKPIEVVTALSNDLEKYDDSFTRAVKSQSPKGAHGALAKFSSDSTKHSEQGKQAVAGRNISEKIKSCFKAVVSAVKAFVKAVGRLISCLFSPITNLFKPKAKRQVSHNKLLEIADQRRRGFSPKLSS